MIMMMKIMRKIRIIIIRRKLLKEKKNKKKTKQKQNKTNTITKNKTLIYNRQNLAGEERERK